MLLDINCFIHQLEEQPLLQKIVQTSRSLACPQFWSPPKKTNLNYINTSPPCVLGSSELKRFTEISLMPHADFGS